jgi:ABC-type uncharacterized transport system involved in gliding motility auxiliary subunit
MKKILTTTGLLMAIALFIAVNIISDKTLKAARLDLTENQLYTLSEGTKNILNNLEEPITLRFFLSQKLATTLPGISSYTVRVKELLEEYQRAAGNQIKLMMIDPEPFSEAEDQAEGYGLQGIPVDDNNTHFYFGLAGTNAIDAEETISFFSPDRAAFLEYDLTKLIYQLGKPKQKVVGIMSTLPLQGDTTSPVRQRNAAQPWMIVEHIRQLFEVRTVKTDVEEIPADIDVLMLVYPKDFSEATLYAIDQYVLKGGRAIVFVDPLSQAYQPQSNPQNPMEALQALHSEFSKLFEAWGIELVPNKVVGDMGAAQKITVPKGARYLRIRYPVRMNLDRDQYFNKESIITSKLGGKILLVTPGAIVKKGDVETEITPLIETGDKAMQINTSKLAFMPPEELARDFKPEGKFTLAALISGKVKTAFPEGKPKDEDEEDSADEKPKTDDTKHLKESAESINLIVVADTDMLENKFWVRGIMQTPQGQHPIPKNANATFVSNALDNLSGSNDLISVRNRGNFARPFTRVEDIQQQAEQKYREKEKELQTRLRETDQKLRELQRQKRQDGNQLMLSIKQREEIARFREKKIEIRKELRDVQHDSQKNIANLETYTKVVNIGLMPLLIGIGGITFGFLSRRRRKVLQQ